MVSGPDRGAADGADVGVAVALVGAASWAISSALLASQARHIDTLSASVLRLGAALVFFIVVLFAIGAESDLGRMSALEFIELAAIGLLALAVGESLYAAAVATIGMTRAFTTVVVLYNLFAFLLAAVFLGETVQWDVAVGSVLVLVGVYLVVLYGRARAADGEGDSSISPHGAAEVRLPLIGQVRPTLRLGIALAVFNGLAWGAAAVWLQAAGDQFDESAVGTARLPLAAGILMIAAIVQPGSSLRRLAVPARPLAILLVSGILANGVAGLLFIIALEEIGTGRTVILYSLAPLMALPIGAFFLHERITVWVAAGTLLAVVGVILIA